MKYILLLIFASSLCFGQQAGDDVTNPIAVPFGQWLTYSNSSATNSGYSPSTCGTWYQDQWFSFTMPLSGTIDLRMRSNVIPTGRVAIFQGTYPTLTQLDCQTFGASMLVRIVSGTPGQQCLMQVAKNAASATAGSYSFSIEDHVTSYCTPNVSITSDQGSSVCMGTSVTFSASPLNGGTTPTYQWLKNGVNIATGSSYTTNALTTNDEISCLLFSNSSCGYPRPVASNTLTMQVFSSIAPSVTLSYDQDPATSGGNVFAIKATAAFGGTAPVYQWLKNGTALGTNSNLLVTSNLKTNDLITCQLTSNATCVSSTNASSTITIKERVMDSLSCWKKITSGGFYNLGIKQDGSLWAWGSNQMAQLGDYSTVDRKTPKRIGTDTTWEFIAAGNYSSFGIKKNGTLWAWGNNGDGQTGQGNTTTYTYSVPIQVGVDNDWVFVTSKASKAFAIKTNGTLWAWGKSTSGLGGGLGDGTTTSRSAPVQIGTDNDWAAVSVGYYHSIALKMDGSLFAWGYNSSGQVGDGTTVDKLSPVVVGTHKFVRISAGNTHNLAIKPDGTLWSWGRNSAGGGLGNGTTSSSSPIMISSSTDWKMVQTYQYTNHGLKNNGTRWGWGYGDFGVLGSGSTGNVTTITQLGTETDWNFVSVGESHTLALKKNAAIWAWGRNLYGEFGNNATINQQLIPVQVMAPCLLLCPPTYTTLTHSICDGASYLFNGINRTTAGVYLDTLIAVTGCDSIITLNLSITNTITPSINIISDLGNSICSGTTVTFTATVVNGGSSPTYQWKKNSLNVGTGTTYTVSNLLNSNTVSCILTSNATCATPLTVTSNSIIFTVTNTLVPSVVIGTTSNTICGSSAVFTTTITNGGSTPAYQWKKNGINVGSNISSYSPTSLISGDIISCELTSNAACTSPLTVLSNSVTMTVNPALTPAVSISSDLGNTICSGSLITFSATPVNGGSTPAYQWKKNGTNVSTGTTYTVSSLVNSDVISCVLTSNALCASPTTAASNSITMTVNTLLTPAVSITSDLGNTICSGSLVTFSATPLNGGSTPAYQWKKNGTNIATGATYTISNLVNSDVISCVLTSNASCANPLSVTSNSITFTVTNVLVPSVIIGTANSTICGSSAVFTATITNGGSTPVYQWKKNGVNVGSNISTYSPTSLNTNDIISCILTSNAACASPLTAQSNSITITVNPVQVPSVSITSDLGNTICSGSTVTFSATPVNGGSGPLYQWKKNGVNVATGTVYTISNLLNSDAISCVLTSNVLCANPTVISSNTITITVNALPVITVNSGTVCLGRSFIIIPSGATTYTYSSGTNVVSPVTTSTYTITGTDANGCVNTTGAISTVSVNALPVISVNSGSVCAGNSFVIVPNGASTYTISGGVFNVSPTATTSYSITGTNALGCVSSNTAVSAVTVNALPVISVNSGSVCAGNSFAIVPNGALTYTISGGSFNVSPTATTNYSVTGTSALGCMSSNVAVSTVSVNAKPTLSVNSGTICSGNSFTIIPNGANTYTITGGAFNVSPTATTSYSVTGTSVLGCVSSNIAVSTVSVNTLPTISVNSGTVCAGNSFVIVPNGASTYTVSGGVFNVTPTATTSYSITGTSTQGCVSSNTAVSTVSVNTLPTISVNSGTVCAGNSFVIVPNGASTYTVSGGVFNVTPIATTAYTVTGTSTQGCVSSNIAISTVSVTASPVISVNNGTICSGNSFTITPSGASTYSITGGSFNVSPTTTTVYSVTGTSMQGCLSSNTAISSVTVNALPTISITSSQTIICVGETANLTAGGAITYVWDMGSTGSVLAVSPTTTSNYTVTGTSSNGCSAMAAITQSVSLCTGIENYNNTEVSVSVYPNPTKGIVTVNVNTEASIIVVNALGQILLNESVGAGDHMMDIQREASGIYFVKVITATKQYTFKLIRE